MTVCTAAAAATYDANAAFQANENSANATNSSFGPFTAGYQTYYTFDGTTYTYPGTTPAAGTFNAFGASDYSNSIAGNANTQGFKTANNTITPLSAVNVSTTAPGFAGLAPGEIFLHPGSRAADGYAQPSSDGALQFAATFAGSYFISGAFRSLASGAVDVHVLLNGVSIFDDVDLSSTSSFSLTETLAVGDKVTFLAGPSNDTIGSDSTGLVATLTTPAPEPASAALLVLGSLPFLLRRRVSIHRPA